MTESPLSIFRARLPLWFVMPLIGVTLIFGLFGGFLVSFVFNRPAECPEAQNVCEEFTVFWEAWKLANERFVDAEAIDQQAMISGAVNGMLDSLGDQGHTYFLNAEQAQEWDESLNGSFEGIGAYIDVRDGQTMIVAPIKGSPAEAAGILPGDVVLEVNGEPTTGWTTDELAAKVRGPEGTQVTLKIVHPGEETPVEIVITRANVVVPSVDWSMLPNEVALIQLSSFDSNSSDQMREAIEAAQQEGAQAVILDLRNNPGGLLNEAIKIAGLFLPANTTVLLEENREGERTPMNTDGEGIALDIPLVVLVNQNSASSSEILAGALQDAERATIVGETTFGTGTVLTPFRLDGGARLLLGTMQWLTPDGRLIRNQGISPDDAVALPVEVLPLDPTSAGKLSEADLLVSDDSQLVRAVELANQAVGQQAQP